MSEKKYILVVDDEENICFLLKEALEMEGFGVDIANSGESALLKVQNNPPNFFNWKSL